MKMRRVIVQVEIETDAKVAHLKLATLALPGGPKGAGSHSTFYLDVNRVNVIRESTKPRKRKRKA
jgi:hypothetical protein